MTHKKKRLSKFNFEGEGAAVALVGDFQGGPANGVTTLITKATSDISEEDLKKAEVELEKDSQPSVDSQGEDVVKTEGTETEINKEVNTMTAEVNKDVMEEQITKAAEEIVAKRVAEIEKAAEAKVEAFAKELEVFKAREEARSKQEYLAKAEGFAKYLGEDADKEAIAKSLAAVEKSEDAKAIMDVLKSLKDTLDKESGFEEIGKSATEDQPTDDEAKIASVQKSLMEGGMPEVDAYVKAFEQVKGA